MSFRDAIAALNRTHTQSVQRRILELIRDGIDPRDARRIALKEHRTTILTDARAPRSR